MMHEVFSRRFAHTEWPKPDVVLIDGGPGQLSIAQKILDTLELDIRAISIAKGRGDSDRFYGTQNIRPHSAIYHFLQKARDEVHRFAITTHRRARQKNLTKSQLDVLPGIGPARRKALLQHFGSFEEVVKASIDDLQLVNGISKDLAERIWHSIRKN